MDRITKAWMLKTAKQQHWRVRAVCDLAELVQDGHMLFHIVAARYDAKSKSHLMALFKTTFANHINSLSRRCRKQAHVSLACDADVDLALIPQEPVTSIDFAPAEVRRLIDACNARPRRLSIPRRANPDGTRESDREWLSRVAGYDVPDDVHTQLLAFMRG